MFVDVRGKTILRELNNNGVDLKQQIKYFENTLNSVGLSSEMMSKYQRTDITKVEDPVEVIERHFSFINDMINYFIAEYTTPERQSKIVDREIVSDGSDCGNFLALHYIDEKSIPNIRAFNFETLYTSGIIKTNYLTEEKSWDEKRVFIFKREIDMAEKDSVIDEYFQEAFREFIPIWKKNMEDIGIF